MHSVLSCWGLKLLPGRLKLSPGRLKLSAGRGDEPFPNRNVSAAGSASDMKDSFLGDRFTCVQNAVLDEILAMYQYF